MIFERKFGGKLYKVVYVEWASLYKGYGGETATKAAAMKKVKALRKAGYFARAQKELHMKHPSRGKEVFYVVYARKEGMTLDQVEVQGRKIVGG